MLRIINIHFDVGHQLHQFEPKRFDPFGQCSFHLFERQLEGPVRLGPDQIDHSLRLRQVNPPVQKRSFSKFSRLGKPGACMQH
ncbi:hypothetical protein D3C86_1914840 [compost metagenome]